MGKVKHTEKSSDNKFQFTLWENDNENFMIEIRKFNKIPRTNGMDFNKYESLTFTPGELKSFRLWLEKF